jgi:hypothetical protein
MNNPGHHKMILSLQGRRYVFTMVPTLWICLKSDGIYLILVSFGRTQRPCAARTRLLRLINGALLAPPPAHRTEVESWRQYMVHRLFSAYDYSL